MRDFVALLSLATATLTGVAAAAEPSVAAQFRMEEKLRHAPAQSHEWRLWRSDDHVLRQDLPAGEIEEWQRDGEVILHRRLYPADRRGVEFQPADLAMIQAQRSWADLSSIVPPEVLAQLDAGKTKVVKGIPQRTYAGKLDGVRWKVVLRTDLRVPVSVDRSDRDGRQRLTLVEAHPLSATPWAAPDSGDYDVMDFADLGDHEHDPFAQRVEALIGLAQHGHSH
ncbi:MAG: hypothetical protein ABW136_00080 [Steroidobacteraceae bacterium]